jgi:hypothetical protein
MQLQSHSRPPSSTPGLLAGLHRFLIPVIGLVAAGSVAWIYANHLSNGPLRDDAAGYYLYLPAVWLYHDFALTDPRLLHPTWAFHHFAATGYNGNIYEFGVALLCSPLFLLGHFVEVGLGARPSGYSTGEQLGAIATAVTMLLVGVWSLKRSLDRRFSAPVVIAAITCVVFGSSVFDYAVMDSLYSHIFAFGLVCALLPASEAWQALPASRARALLLGGIGGLLALVRLTDVLFVALPFGYLVFSEPSPGAGLRRLWAHRVEALLIGVAAFAVWLPQLVYYRYSAGYWTADMYLGMQFNWLRPQVLNSLFSFDPHGLLPYAPVLLLALPGFVLMVRRRSPWAYPILAVWLLNFYLITSWPEWSFGSGFGLRPYVDSTGLLALPLATLFSSVRGRVLQAATLLVGWLLVMTTVVQMIHYWHGLIPWTGISPAGYFRVLFLI